MKLSVAPSAAAAAATAAAMLAAEIATAVKSRGVCSIALSGGQTPWQMLEALLNKPVSWAAVHVFQVDERVVPFDDERRNARRIRELLVRPGGLPAAHFHAMPVDGAAPQTATNLDVDLSNSGESLNLAVALVGGVLSRKSLLPKEWR